LVVSLFRRVFVRKHKHLDIRHSLPLRVGDSVRFFALIHLMDYGKLVWTEVLLESGIGIRHLRFGSGAGGVLANGGVLWVINNATTGFPPIRLSVLGVAATPYCCMPI
jgi:hypothetical protein